MLVRVKVNAVHVTRDDDFGNVEKSRFRLLRRLPVKYPECFGFFFGSAEALREVRLTDWS
jgi:hypothetical protein